MHVHTFENLGKNAKAQAEMFRACLAVDKGYTSTLKTLKGGFRVIASDGKTVDFLAGTK